MKRWALITCITLTLAIFLAVALSSAQEEKNNDYDKVSEQLKKNIEKGGKVKAIVQIEKSDKDVIEFEYLEVDKKELDELVKTEFVKNIDYDYPVRATLDESRVIIGADKSEQLDVDNTKLTGKGKSVCIVDSGVDFNHPDIAQNYLGGYDFVHEDDMPEDDFGHGTHVAGVVAASGAVRGVAIKAGIVAVKVLDENGNGNSSDVIQGIEYCTNRSEEFNISVITLSLGVNCGLYPSGCSITYCDSVYRSYTQVINEATEKGIKVVAASGNQGGDLVPLPGCIKNAIRVAASDKGDAFWNKSNRNDIVRLVAPGDNIYSTYKDNKYISMSGTSMAVPHVAASILILDQYLSATNKEVSRDNIEEVLYKNGKMIYDSKTTLNFSRIDLYATLIDIDYTLPEVNLTNKKVNLVGTNVSLTCKAKDWQLANASIIIWKDGNEVYSNSIDVDGEDSEQIFVVDSLETGEYEWNCFVTDKKSNTGNAQENNTLDIRLVLVELEYPSQNKGINTIDAEFSCHALNMYSAAEAELFLWQNGEIIHNENKTVDSGNVNFNYTNLSEGEYEWNCAFRDNTSDNIADENGSFYVDYTSPVIMVSANSNGSENELIELRYNVTDNYKINVCKLNVDANTTMQENISLASKEGKFSVKLGAGTHNWTVECIDTAGNLGRSESNNITISQTVHVIPNSNSGGKKGKSGSSGSSNVIVKKTEAPTNETKVQEDLPVSAFDNLNANNANAGEAGNGGITGAVIGGNSGRWTFALTSVVIIVALALGVRMRMKHRK